VNQITLEVIEENNNRFAKLKKAKEIRKGWGVERRHTLKSWREMGYNYRDVNTLL
jgi:hypothetical protein